MTAFITLPAKDLTRVRKWASLKRELDAGGGVMQSSDSSIRRRREHSSFIPVPLYLLFRLSSAVFRNTKAEVIDSYTQHLFRLRGPICPGWNNSRVSSRASLVKGPHSQWGPSIPKHNSGFQFSLPERKCGVCLAPPFTPPLIKKEKR